MTRPEISYLVSKAGSVSSSPKLNHLNILLNLIGYLKWEKLWEPFGISLSSLINEPACLLLKWS